MSIRLPLAVGFSIALSLSIHVLQARYGFTNIRGAWVGLTCAVIMDMSVPERILVRAVLRALGSIVGAMLGVILALIYEKMGREDTEPNLGQQLFQMFSMIFVALMCAISVKLFKDFTYAFLLTLFTASLVLVVSLRVRRAADKAQRFRKPPATD